MLQLDDKIKTILIKRLNKPDKAEGSPNGMALVSKTSGSNPLQVQVLYPPLCLVIILLCGAGLSH